jgi:uncharacterized membrane protein YgdD (TMEM256/DUF423 family)
MDARKTLAIAGALLALATVLGAFGAHALKAHLPADRLQVYETAVRYHFLHSLGLLAIGILFSGSLYLLTFGAPRFLGVITPIGGLALIGGWILFAVTVLRQ